MVTVRETSGVRFPPPLISAIALAIGLTLHWVRPASIVSEEGLTGLRLLGGLLIVLGIGLWQSAVRVFRSVGTNVSYREPTTALVEKGPYRFTRNPMVIALAATQAGIALVVNGWWPLLTLVPALLITRYAVITHEERYLETKFGDAYHRYTERVRRWL